MLDILTGVKVIDLTSNVAGPFCTLILADLGATVWKVEPPDGDVVRRWPPFSADGTSTTFLALNRGKQSVALDLKEPGGQADFIRMAEAADVVVSSLRPGSLDRLGLGPSRLTEVNPRLICADLSAFGGVGPRGDQPGFDAVLQAYTGLMDLTGYPDQPPARVGTGIVDFGTGMWMALGVVSALLKREHEGTGSAVSATLFGTAVGFLMHHLAAVEFAGVVPSRIGTAQHNSAPYEGLATADGMVMVGVTSPPLWRRFCAAIGAPDLADEPEYLTNDVRVARRPALHARIESYTATMSRDELVRALEAHGVPCSPVRTVGELVDDPQLDQAGLWQPTDHGGRVAAVPLRIGPDLPSVGARAPGVGEHTAEVLDALGGMTPDRAAPSGAASAGSRRDGAVETAQDTGSESTT